MPHEVRDAVAADFLSFYGQMPAQSVRAKVLVRGDEVLGIAGYYMENGVAVVFTDNRALPKMTIWREAIKFMQSLTIPAICRCTETSGPFLERLGWVHIADGVYRHEP